MLKELINIADSTLVNFVSKLGTNRDKASHDTFGWYTPRSIMEFDNLYKTDSVAKKIVRRPVQDMFRQGYYFNDLSGNGLDKLKTELKRLHIDEHLTRALKLARLHGKSYILLGMNDNQLLSMPNRGGELSYITVLRKDQLNPTNERLSVSEALGFIDKPVYYQLQNTKGLVSGLIHHTRILVIEWDDGESVLQTLHSELLRLASVNANVASLVHESKVDVIKTYDLMNQIKLNSDVVLKRFAMLGLMKSNNGMLVLDKEQEDYESKHYSFGGLPELMREFAIQTAGAADIPYTILFGQSPAGLNSTGEHDLVNYYDTVASYQRWYLRPIMEKLLTIICGYVLGGQSVDFTFNPLWQLDEKTRSEVDKNNAERDIKYLAAGIIDEAQIAKQLVEDGVYTVIDEAHIKLLESMGLDNAATTDTTAKASQSV